MDAGSVLGLVVAAYLLVGAVWASVVLFLGRGDGTTGEEHIIFFVGILFLWPAAAFVVIPQQVRRLTHKPTPSETPVEDSSSFTVSE